MSDLPPRCARKTNGHEAIQSQGRQASVIEAGRIRPTNRVGGPSLRSGSDPPGVGQRGASPRQAALGAPPVTCANGRKGKERRCRRALIQIAETAEIHGARDELRYVGSLNRQDFAAGGANRTCVRGASGAGTKSCY